MAGVRGEGGQQAGGHWTKPRENSRSSKTTVDAQRLVTHPSTTTQRGLTPEARAELGISEGFVRFSAGLEHKDDVIEDLVAALEKALASKAKK